MSLDLGTCRNFLQNLQVQVIDKMLHRNLDFSWSTLYLEINYWYNHMFHSTNKFSPWQLMFGTSYEHSIDRFYSHDDLN